MWRESRERLRRAGGVCQATSGVVRSSSSLLSSASRIERCGSGRNSPARGSLSPRPRLRSAAPVTPSIAAHHFRNTAHFKPATQTLSNAGSLSRPPLVSKPLSPSFHPVRRLPLASSLRSANSSSWPSPSSPSSLLSSPSSSPSTSLLSSTLQPHPPLSLSLPRRLPSLPTSHSI